MPEEKHPIKIGVGIEPITETVIVTFGTPIAWLKLTKEEALAFSKEVLLWAQKLRGQTGRENPEDRG